MTTDMHKAPSVARKALTSRADATPVARYDLSTSEGGRRYMADFFTTELRRHDFARYINTHLAADFACALAQHLAATGKQQVGEVQGDVRPIAQALRVAFRHLDMGSMRVSHCKDAAIIESAMKDVDTFDLNAAISALAARQPGVQTFQAGVSEWMGQCFLPSLYSNMTERGDRLLEEVLELLQSHGYDPVRVATLVDYVFGRPVGEPAQEVGGVMVTLAGYCWVAGLDMHAAGVAELQRINQPEVMDTIRRKQEAKNALHFDTPLPGDAAANVEEWPREGDLVRYGDGSSALAIRLGPHAGGWHGYQCCGGHTFFTKAHRPSRADMDTWLDCAKYRDERTKVADSRVAQEMDLIDGKRNATREPRSHRWDDVGERCLDCGDKDWMADPSCSGPRDAAPGVGNG